MLDSPESSELLSLESSELVVDSEELLISVILVVLLVLIVFVVFVLIVVLVMSELMVGEICIGSLANIL